MYPSLSLSLFFQFNPSWFNYSVRDGELFNYINEKKKLSEDEARFIFWQLFLAIQVSKNTLTLKKKKEEPFFNLFFFFQYLHQCGIAHRDLKPENGKLPHIHSLFILYFFFFSFILLVLLADKKKLLIKVSDFGLAKSEDRKGTFDSQCGTPNYGKLKLSGKVK